MNALNSCVWKCWRRCWLLVLLMGGCNPTTAETPSATPASDRPHAEAPAAEDGAKKGSGKPVDLPLELGRCNDALRKWNAAEGAQQQEQDALRKQFETRLQRIAPHLSALTPARGLPQEYAKLTLNQARKGFDAFRFKTPPGKANWDLDWELVARADSVDAWYIVPAEGAMQGFEQFTHWENHEEPGVELPQPNFRVKQQLEGGRLRPDAEYVIWFSGLGDQPVDLHIRLGVTEAR
jgi:hypothetical protein